jgi:hypothetical protein
MKKQMLGDLDKYAYWIKVNNVLMGPSLIISSFIIISYCIATILFIVKPEVMSPYLTYYYIAFPFFIMSVWLAFTGFLLKEY